MFVHYIKTQPSTSTQSRALSSRAVKSKVTVNLGFSAENIVSAKGDKPVSAKLSDNHCSVLLPSERLSEFVGRRYTSSHPQRAGTVPREPRQIKPGSRTGLSPTAALGESQALQQRFWNRGAQNPQERL